MPYLIIIKPFEGTAEEFELEGNITTLGCSESCDIPLKSDGVKELHCHIYREGSDYYIATPDGDLSIYVDGKRVNRAQLRNGSIIEIGNARGIFVEGLRKRTEARENGKIDAFGKVVEFSEKLMSSQSLDDLLQNLMQYIVNLTHADNGFLLLFENGKIKLKTAFGINPESLDESINRLSDSIIARVLKEKKSVIVSDAVTDSEFRNAESVINLNLHSVMCVPLMLKDRLMGLIYLGSQSVKNLFTHDDLEVLKIFASQASLLIHNSALIGELRAEHSRLIDKLGEATFGSLIGNSGVMQNLYRGIKAMAGDTAPVLLVGEDGTEKETVAFTIHKESQRKGQFGMLKAGIYSDLQFDIEFSGVVKGGVPGAIYPRKGKVHLCKNGTLYIEDIERIPGHVQMKILGVIKESIITRVGSATPEKVDVRLIFSTVDPENALKHFGLNRELYTILSGRIIKIPPLRERREDIELLAGHFLEKFKKQYGKNILGLTQEAIKFLKSQDWEGNLLEFENRIRRAVTLSETDFIAVDDLEV